MRAAVYLGSGEVRIEERAVPSPGPGEVVVAMRACGICGSDLMEWYVAKKAPVVLGHEPAGVVVAVGPELDAPLPVPGTRVFVHHHGIPFYVAGPRSTLDPGTATGAEIEIEQRDGGEVRGVAGLDVTTAVWNPAFDVTPAELITGLITEVGVLRAPYGPAIASALRS